MMDKKIFHDVPDVVHNAVLDTLGALEEKNDSQLRAGAAAGKNWKKRGFARYLCRAAAVGAVCLLVSGITVSAAKIVTSYKDRMEEMDTELLLEYYAVSTEHEALVYSRPLTEEEFALYEELTKEYENNGVFPETQIVALAEGEAYAGTGVALDETDGIIYIPDETLSDEEMLEIIDFLHMIRYGEYVQNEQRIISEDGWELRMRSLTDEEVDEIYFSVCGSNSELSQGYSRPLTEDEQLRYEELLTAYEEDGVYCATSLSIIQKPAEYTGEGVALCVSDSTYHIPDSELTDDELLQIIDYNHKVTYCFERIKQDIADGLRDGYPKKTVTIRDFVEE